MSKSVKNVFAGDPMPEESKPKGDPTYPRCMYHRDGRVITARNAEQATAAEAEGFGADPHEPVEIPQSDGTACANCAGLAEQLDKQAARFDAWAAEHVIAGQKLQMENLDLRTEIAELKKQLEAGKQPAEAGKQPAEAPKGEDSAEPKTGIRSQRRS